MRSLKAAEVLLGPYCKLSTVTLLIWVLPELSRVLGSRQVQDMLRNALFPEEIQHLGVLFFLAVLAPWNKACLSVLRLFGYRCMQWWALLGRQRKGREVRRKSAHEGVTPVSDINVSSNQWNTNIAMLGQSWIWHLACSLVWHQDRALGSLNNSILLGVAHVWRVSDWCGYSRGSADCHSNKSDLFFRCWTSHGFCCST